jgi:hypothetical protein
MRRFLNWTRPTTRLSFAYAVIAIFVAAHFATNAAALDTEHHNPIDKKETYIAPNEWGKYEPKIRQDTVSEDVTLLNNSVDPAR